MKTKSNLCCLIVGVGLLAGAAQAQVFEFTANTHEEKDFYVGLSGFLNYDAVPGQLTAAFFNESLGKAEVTGLYLLRPDNMVGNVALIDGLSGWSEAKNFARGSSSGLGFGKLNFKDYYGVVSSTSDETGLGKGQFAVFSWDLPDSFNNNDTDWLTFVNDKSRPHVIVRWQSVGPDGEDSAKGYAFITLDGTITPVPEPKAIAFLAVVGMGALLWVRGRRNRRNLAAELVK